MASPWVPQQCLGQFRPSELGGPPKKWLHGCLLGLDKPGTPISCRGTCLQRDLVGQAGDPASPGQGSRARQLSVVKAQWQEPSWIKQEILEEGIFLELVGPPLPPGEG